MPKFSEIETRDWLAAQALSGILSGSLCPPMQSGVSPSQHADRLAKLAYEFADALIRASTHKPKP